MFPRSLRLREKRLFDSAFRRGSWARGKYFSVVHMSLAGTGKIGFVVTKKVTKHATERNRIKRRMRAALQQVLVNPAYQDLLRNKALVIVVHQSVTSLPFAQLLTEITHVLDKVQMGRS